MHVYNAQTISDESGAASFVSDWLAVGAAGFADASYTLDWTAVASTAGALTFEGTDDPSGAKSAALTVDKQHGSDISAVDANAGTAVVILTNCPGYVRVRWTRSAGGGAAQFNAFVTLRT